MPRGDLASDTEFRHAVESLLGQLLEQLDTVESDDIDAMMTPGNLILKFEEGSTFVLSQQTPTHELWLSANLTAWHFVHEGGAWVERDSGEALPGLLAHLVSGKLGMQVHLHT